MRQEQTLNKKFSGINIQATNQSYSNKVMGNCLTISNKPHAVKEEEEITWEKPAHTLISDISKQKQTPMLKNSINNPKINESTVIIRQTSVPTYFSCSPKKIVNVNTRKGAVLRQKSAPSKYGSPKKMIKKTSSTSINTTSNIPCKTLTLVRGESCSLIDIETYIGSLGSVGKVDACSVEIFPSASPKPRPRINLTQKRKVDKGRKNSKLLIFSLSICLVAFLFLLFCAILSTNNGHNESDIIDHVGEVKEYDRTKKNWNYF